MVQNWQKVKAAKDKEGLFEEQLQLQRQLTSLKEENSSLIAKQTLISEEHEKLANYILQIEQVVINKMGPKLSLPQLLFSDLFLYVSKKSWLVLNLKTKLIEIRESIDEKSLIVEKNKRDPQFLKRQEHEIVMNLYNQYVELIEEKQKSLKQLQNQRNNKQESPLDDDEDIPLEEFEKLSPRSMRRNVAQLRTNLAIIKEENEQLQVQRDSLSKKTQYQQKRILTIEEETDFETGRIVDLVHSLSEYQELDDELQPPPHHRKLYPKAESHHQDSSQSKSYQEQIKEFQANERNQIYLQHQKEQIDQQQIQIQQLSIELKELKEKYEQDKINVSNRKKKLSEELNRIQRVCAQSRVEEKELDQQIQKLSLKSYPKSFGKTLIISQNILQKQDHKRVLKVPKIESIDIQKIAKEINYRLRLRRIPMDYVISVFIPQHIKQTGFTSIEYITKKLREDPFNVPEKAEALKLARFLVEDNSESMIEINLGRKCHYKVARSVLKSVVGHVKIFSSDDEEYAIWNQCVQEIFKNQMALKQYGEQHFLKRGTDANVHVSWQNICEALTYVSNEFTQEQIDYILIRSFELTNNINSLPFFKIFDTFRESSWKPIDQRAKNSMIFKPGQITYVQLDHHSKNESEDDL